MRFLLFLIAALGGCGQVDRHSDPKNGAVREEAVGASALATYSRAEATPGSPQPAFHLARMDGVLALNYGCVGLTSGGKFLTLAFLEGEAMWDDKRQVLSVGDIIYPLGSRIAVGGSITGGAVVKSLLAAVPERCRNIGLWYVAPGTVSASKPGQKISGTQY